MASELRTAGRRRGARWAPEWLSLIAAAVLLLSGCDGGIFGTGSGNDNGPGMVATTIEGGGASMANPAGVAGDTAAGSDAGSSETDADTGGGANAGTDGGTNDGANGGANGIGDGGTTADGAGSEEGGDDGGRIDGGTDGSSGDGTTAPPFEDPDDAEPPEPGGPPSSEAVPQSGFSNTLSGGTEPAPRVGMINATARSLRLYRDDGNSLFPIMSVPAQDEGRVATVPMSSVALMLFDLDDAADDTAMLDPEDALYRIEPLALGTASVTSLLARESDDGRGVDVVPLATQTISDDPAQSLVRVVLAVDIFAEMLPDAVFMLTPEGASPGGAEVVFSNPSYLEPSSAYLAVAAGDYRLSVTDDRVDARSLNIPPGKVFTLVVTARDAVSIIVDSLEEPD